MVRFSILEFFFSRREKGDGNELSIGKENSVSIVFFFLEKIYCIEKIVGVY